MSAHTPTADRIEIADLFSRFAQLLDEKRWDDADTIWTEDVAVHSPRTETHGIDKVVAFLRQSEVEGEHTQHMTTDLLVAVDGDEATVSANSLVHYYRDNQPPHLTSGLRLTCGTVRTPRGWRIHRSQITLSWTREN